MTAIETTSAGPQRQGGSPQKRRSIEKRQAISAYLFILPFFVVFIAMLIIPLLYSGYLSLFQTKLVGGETFAGLDNYIRALTDIGFLTGLGRVALFMVIQVPIMLAIALFFALAFDSGRVRGMSVMRLLIFIPYAVPGVVATLMWGYLYGLDFGPISQAFRALGLTAPNLLSEQNVLGSMMNIVAWSFIGYNMIIMFAALRSIPHELFEAAELDGASEWRIAWSIKIPAIRPAIVLTLIFSVIGSFQLFNEPSLLRNLAPTVINSSFTPNFYAYNLAFTNSDVNYAAAVAFLLGLIIAVFSYVVQIISQKKEGTRS